MKVSDVMSRAPRVCRDTDTLDRAAQLMWDHDCGFLPVVNEKGGLAGTITDRDICMAAWTQGKTPAQIPAAAISRHSVFTVNQADSIEAAELLMLRKQVRRLPVLDAEGKLVGVVSLADLAQRLESTANGKNGISRESVAQTLAGISRPRQPGTPLGPAMSPPVTPVPVSKKKVAPAPPEKQR